MFVEVATKENNKPVTTESDEGDSKPVAEKPAIYSPIKKLFLRV